MEIGKMILAFAVAMALSISALTLMINTTNDHQGGAISRSFDNHEAMGPPKRVSRFLVAEKERNPRAANHCMKDHSVCTAGGKNETCCNNKCIDLSYDNKNCGACKKKCLFTQTCCRGECVYLSYDPRHCGECNFRCKDQKYCVYGICNYA